jgi:hypothetical protein
MVITTPRHQEGVVLLADTTKNMIIRADELLDDTRFEDL